ncbi:MAG: tyrosine-type recombinase/integrase, partial [Firmicutes bacterium]|nr:tyrosine-type recombinase/integrase [Bacillota bacterium]
REGLLDEGEEFDNMYIGGADLDFYSAATFDEVNKFLSFVKNDRMNNARTRARKLSSLRGFYKYYTSTKKSFSQNPLKDMENPKLEKSLPKHLELEESLELLQCVSSDETSKTRDRDYAIITLFLNCGMRLSELCGINLSDLSPDLEKLTVTGKGAKQRTVYLNEACASALRAYLDVRGGGRPIDPKHSNALFLSSRNLRISIKTVQWMVYKYLRLAGLEYKHLSVHKLRHTAATLMYQTGEVDIRVLKDILGHEQLNTTQIYTHVSDEGMKKAMEKNPLAGVEKSKKN